MILCLLSWERKWMFYVITGAYELQKAVKEHESPMYILVSSNTNSCSSTVLIWKVYLEMPGTYSGTPLKWTPLGPKFLSTIVSLAQGLVVDHTPPTIAASYAKALLWTTKKTKALLWTMKKNVLMRDLPTDSS